MNTDDSEQREKPQWKVIAHAKTLHDHEYRRICAARKAYKLHRDGHKPEGHASWPEWWTDMYGEGQTFDQFVEEQMNGRHRRT